MEALSILRLFLGGFLLAVCLPPGAKAIGCPRGWMEWKGNCYGLFNLKVTWVRAELACQSFWRNSHLASIVNQEEMEQLSRYIDQNYHERSSIWIGMYENKVGSLKKRHFEWTDRSPTEYTLWAPGEPRRLKKQCAVLCKPDYKMWCTRLCDMYLPYLCKFEKMVH